MKIEKTGPKSVYFTADHEWIDFRGAVAYTGVCAFKLLGFKEVQRIVFCEPTGFLKKGAVIASIRYNDYLVEAHMPVDGKIMQLNEELVSGNRQLLLLQPGNAGWIAMIAPAQPYERKDLLLPRDYQMNGKTKQAK